MLDSCPGLRDSSGRGQLTAAEAGYRAPIENLTDKPIGVHYRVADTAKMNEFYRPKITLEEGIRRALKVFR